MNQAEDWNQAYTKGTLRRKHDMDNVIMKPTDIDDMYPLQPHEEMQILVGGIVVLALVIIGGLILAGWLSV